MRYQNRRKFLANACKACLAGAVSLPVIDLLSSCSTPLKGYKAVMTGNKVEIPLKLFDIAVVQLVSPKNYPYEIAVRKLSDHSFEALLLCCTHQQNPLVPTGDGYTCTIHGSQFDKSGSVKKGPAALRLQQLTTTIQTNTLIIHV